METIYSSFDKIAALRGVFKVETVGDCYVAATGIPEAQSNHTIIMMRFSRDCMSKMSQIVHNLAATMGEDTRELTIRVGLHSGGCTAGVLRGEKGRFQLFGDTVNTAGRMESTCIPGRIHVSQAFADELTAKGKAYELVKREDAIEVKGQGAIQTYLAQKSQGSTRSSSGIGTNSSSHSASSGDVDVHADALQDRLSRRLTGRSMSSFQDDEDED